MHYGVKAFLDIENIDGFLCFLVHCLIYFHLDYIFLFNLFFSSNGPKMGKPSLDEIPIWVFNLYDFSHSLIIALIFILIVYRFNKNLCFPMLAWPFHILLDVFTHSKEFFPTPIFWPISDYRFDGIPWSNPYIWFANIFCIFIIFIYRRK